VLEGDRSKSPSAKSGSSCEYDDAICEVLKSGEHNMEEMGEDSQDSDEDGVAGEDQDTVKSLKPLK